MEIKNKVESIRIIKSYGLNQLPEGLFYSGEEEKVKKFLTDNPAKLYAIRDRTKTGGVFKFNVKREDVLKEIKGYTIFTINISTSNYEGHQLLTGDVKVSRDGSVYMTASTDPGASVRSAYASPDFNFQTDIFDDRVLNSVPGFDYIFKYLYQHNLIDVIVEFSLFDICVGTQNDKMVIWELRTHY